MGRSAHLVGSVPAADTDEAMRLALDELGPRLETLPDGETGERSDWIVHIVEALREHPDLEVRHEGGWSDYDDTVTHRVKFGHRLDGRSVDFGHVAAFTDSYPVFRRLRDEVGRPEMSFQVGIPGDFDMALFTLGPTGPLLHRWPFTVATLREIHAIHRRGAGDVVFQIEVPAELVAVAQTPGPLQPALAAYLARGIAFLGARAPEDARFGIHLCLGDMNNRALGEMGDVRPLVVLSNAIVSRWPAGRTLEYLHVPLAAGQDPPPLLPGYYEPLGQLDVPAGTRLIAGLVHEDQSLDAQEWVLGQVETLVGGRVDLAAACGLGRRSRDDALEVMRQTDRLCEA